MLPSRWKGFIVVIFQEGAQLLVIQHADEPNEWQVSPAKVAIGAEHVVHEPWSSHCLGRKFSKLFQTSNSDFCPEGVKDQCTCNRSHVTVPSGH